MRKDIYFVVKDKQDNEKLLETLGFHYEKGRGFFNGNAHAHVPWSTVVHIWCSQEEYELFQQKAQASGLLDKKHPVNSMTFAENVQNLLELERLRETYIPTERL